MSSGTDFYIDKTVVVTGGAGFVGSHVVEQLVSLGASVVVPVRPSTKGIPANLSSVADKIKIVPADYENLESMIDVMKGADVVMHLAAAIGGVQFSSAHQASIFQGNLSPFLTVSEAARQASAGRFLVCSTACVYPADAIHPTPESEGFRGFPQVTNEGYGMAKRMQEYLGMKYIEEFGMDVRIARPFNCYGPRDDMDPATSHVIPALIRKILKSEDAIEVWGDGTATRSFIYVDDFARGLLLTAEKGPIGKAVNIGPDDEISIKELCVLLMKACGKQLKLNWDTSKPTGQQRRGCDTTFAKKAIGFSSQVTFQNGLQKTVDWFKNELAVGRASL
jgi:GDP-L-fucose synthase